jgi:hypothetical protein
MRRYVFTGEKITTVRETTFQLTVILTNVITIMESTLYHYLLSDKEEKNPSMYFYCYQLFCLLNLSLNKNENKKIRK